MGNFSGGPARHFKELLWIVFLTIQLGGCSIVQTPLLGMAFTDVKYPQSVTALTKGQKSAKVCSHSILGLFAWGDSSVEHAKAKGEITTVSAVDAQAKSYLGLYGRYCTVVNGD